MSAADANIRVGFRYQEVTLVGYHIDCFGRTAFGTGAASRFLCFDNAVVFNKNSFSDLGKLFGLKDKRTKGIGRAYFGASYTIISAETFNQQEP